MLQAAGTRTWSCRGSRSDDDAAIAGHLLAWAEAHGGVRVVYGQGAHEGSAGIRLDDGATLHAFNIWTYGKVEIPFDFMTSFSQAPFDKTETRATSCGAASTRQFQRHRFRLRSSSRVRASASSHSGMSLPVGASWKRSSGRSMCPPSSDARFSRRSAPVDESRLG